MATPDAKIIALLKEFRHFSSEKGRFQRALHHLHDASADLEQALKATGIEAIAIEQQAFNLEERKMHDRADRFEEALHHYQKALKAAMPAVIRSKTISVHGKKYRLQKTGKELTIFVV